jgi:hypothetical protein
MRGNEQSVSSQKKKEEETRKKELAVCKRQSCIAFWSADANRDGSKIAHPERDGTDDIAPRCIEHSMISMQMKRQIILKFATVDGADRSMLTATKIVKIK